ncbi:MAG: CTP synthase [Candidatus Gracilibacteria bacterium]|nr:CTP synthase [Candidatus Gracilibacteria bacterium]MDD4530866.1 CTP synthase [Candidatus Gracilibacteria bacterium]
MKVIVVTGGVLSGIGKGISAASIGAILKSGGYKVFMQKFDGYFNVDTGTMSPFQHGEVFVTEDGAETDLDLGHYERFIDTNLNKLSSFTSGRIFEEVILKERRGDYLGKTVQITPHVTGLVIEKIKEGYKSSGADISIIEVGGTVGDMENEYILEAVRQLQRELGRENMIFVHVTLLPYIAASKEVKTKPTQHAVRTLMSYGITPDFLVLRADSQIPKELCDKVASFCYISKDCVIPAPTAKTIYEVPLTFQKHNIGELILSKLGMENKGFDMKEWENLVDNIKKSKDEIIVGMVGKYNDLEDAYYSLNEGLRTAGFKFNKKVKLQFIDATMIEQDGVSILDTVDGICIPGGFGERGIEGMIMACEYARVNKKPYLGICLGSQIMSIEFARNVLKKKGANSEEFCLNGDCNVVHIMESQKKVNKKGGTMRLGSYDCKITEGTLASKVYSKKEIVERHRHRFEFNNNYREEMQKAGFIVSGTSPDGNLAEIVEVKNHPFMIGSQFHPEFKSRPIHPHPLFTSFVEAMIK